MSAFKIRLEFSLKQINTAFIALGDPHKVDNHEKFLFYKQLEKSITEIHFYIETESDTNSLAKTLHDSPEFKALSKPDLRLLLTSQQETWYPYYLAQVIEKTLERGEKNTPRNLIDIINIIATSNLNGKDKREKITDTVSQYTQTNSFTVLFDKAAALKKQLIEIINVEKQANIDRLSQSKTNNFKIIK